MIGPALVSYRACPARDAVSARFRAGQTRRPTQPAEQHHANRAGCRTSLRRKASCVGLLAGWLCCSLCAIAVFADEPASCAGSCRILREASPPAAGGALLLLPRRQETRGRAATGLCAEAFKGSESGPVLLAGKPEESRLVRAIRYNDKNLQMPPDGKLADEAIAALTRWVEIGLPWPESARRIRGERVERLAKALGFSARAAAPIAGDPKCRLGPGTDRSFRVGTAGAGRPRSVASGGPADVDPPGHVRPDRPASDARGGRGVRRRHVVRRRGPTDRPAAGLAALRRALGPALARRGPLRRHQGLRLPAGAGLTLRLHLPRLRHPRVQRRPALRPVPRCEQLAADQLPLGRTTAPWRRWVS